MNTFDEHDYNKSFDVRLWRQMFGYIGRNKRLIVLIGITMTALAAMDSIFPLATSYAIDNFIGKSALEGMPVFACVYLGMIIFQSVVVFLFIYYAGRLESHIVFDIRESGFARLQELSFSYYDNTPVGWIMARMTSDAQRIGDVIAWGCVDMIWGFAVFIIVFINMAIMNLKLAGLIGLVVPALAVASVYFQKRIFRSQREVRRINSKITGAFNEGINGARTTKTLTREQKNFDEFNELSTGMREVSIRSAVLSAIFLPLVLSLGSIGVALVLGAGGKQVILGTLSYGTFSVFIQYAMLMFEPIQQIARVFAELQSAQASAERTLALIQTQPEIVDRPDVVERYGDGFSPKPENWPGITGDIVFENVNFSYKTGEKVLEGFNLHVRAGEKLALVGETGAGKSTIVNLICRFYEPTSGRILIDGVDYRERSQIWLQSNLGYVLQTPHLFSGTVMENIRYGALDATDEEVINAAKTVNAYDFIMRLEKGFDTDVGEGGDRLSAGEKQLVSFARAILSDPRLFVLDEATSSIDTETEREIQTAVDRVLAGRTSFIVAHRLSTIRSCDRILVIDGGELVESGNHKELMREKGRYYNLYTNQFKRETEDRILSGQE